MLRKYNIGNAKKKIEKNTIILKKKKSKKSKNRNMLNNVNIGFKNLNQTHHSRICNCCKMFCN